MYRPTPALRPQRSNGEHVDIVLGVVAAEGRGCGDDGAELRLGVARCRVQSDLAAQALDVDGIEPVHGP